MTGQESHTGSSDQIPGLRGLNKCNGAHCSAIGCSTVRGLGSGRVCRWLYVTVPRLPAGPDVRGPRLHIDSWSPDRISTTRFHKKQEDSVLGLEISRVRQILASPGVWTVVVCFAWIIVSNFAVVQDATIGILVAVSPLAVVILVSLSWVRVAVVVGGGLLVLGGANEVGAVKIAYAVALLLCAAISAFRLIRDPPIWIKPFLPLMHCGAALLGLLLVGAVAIPGQDAVVIVRQSLVYLILILSPVIGLDAGRDAEPLVVLRWIAIIGCVAAAGFAADWLGRRGVSSLGVGKIVVSSLMLPALAFALGLVRMANERGWLRLMWSIPVVFIPAAMLVTGTRTNLVLFVAIIGVLGSRTKFRVPASRAVAMAVFTTVAVAVVVPFAAQYVIATPGFFESRIQALQMAAQNGIVGDESLAQRYAQNLYVTEAISESPWFGIGLGFIAPISLDTPLAVVARIGILGCLGVLAWLGAAVFAVYRTGKIYGTGYIYTAGTGLIVVFAALSPIGIPTEDKGFGFAMILLFAGVAAVAQKQVSRSNILESTSSYPPELPVKRPSKVSRQSTRIP
jgi:hypothetical protein